MEITLKLDEILKIVKIAGTMKGIADKMQVQMIPTDRSRQSLSEISDELMELMRTKCKEEIEK